MQIRTDLPGIDETVFSAVDITGNHGTSPGKVGVSEGFRSNPGALAKQVALEPRFTGRHFVTERGQLAPL